MKIFVYGTLRIGEYNHSYISDHLVQSHGIYKTVSPFYMVRNKEYSYPYVIPTSFQLELEPTNITGEVYEITEEGLAKIDKLEGIPDHYVRREILVKNEFETLHVGIYLLEDIQYIDIIQKNIGTYFICIKQGDWKQEDHSKH